MAGSTRYIPCFRIVLFILFAVIIGTQAAAQRNEVFSGDQQLFIEELEDYMKNLPEQYEEVLDSFIYAWEEDSAFTVTEMQDIINLSRLLVSRKARAYPHYHSFMSCILAFKRFNTNPQNYANWVEGFSAMLDNRKTKTSEFDNVISVTDNLLRKGYIYSSGSTIWKVSSRQYTISPKPDMEILFDKVDLTCYAKRDSMHLFETGGSVFPIESRWEGSGGLVTWERGGYMRSEVFARIPEYRIDLSKSEYEVENVSFTNKLYFDEPLFGRLEDKVKLNNEPEDATYPRFYSYTKEFLIEDLYENIDYEGGLSMQGAKLVGTGTEEKNAHLNIYRNDTLVLRASSVFFGFRSDRVSSERTSITIKLENDSIYHPDLFFTYRVRNKELTLLKTDNFTSQGPYSNSYHKVDMNFDQLTWNMDEDVMNFTAPRGAAIGNAYFESVNYFNYDKYIDMMLLDERHPLYILKEFAGLYGSDEFPIQAFADYQNMPLHQVQQQTMRMAFGGFVYYDMNTGMVKLKPRLYDYLAASINKIDYDVIGFASRVEAPLENAVYNIKNNDLIINGIPEIQVSDSQSVIIYPRYNRITLKEDRDFLFDGEVEAGLLKFYGNNFFFDYDDFKITLTSVDSLHLEFISGQLDGFGLPMTEHVKNRLQYITGEVLIDDPNNKSGRESNPEYPIFKSLENSYVYYEGSKIEGGVYESSDFFFEVYPFEMDSLDNFNYKDLNFKGEFVSAGVFPAFEKELSLQPDNSLGFYHKTPPEGFPIYGGKGTFNNEIRLSNEGLRGDGVLKYLTSTTWSDDFIFYPDSMNTKSTRYQIEQQNAGTEYPRVNSQNSYIHWLPYADEMYAFKTDTDFNMFNDSTFLKGDLTLTPSGLSGRGRMDLRNSDLRSDYFTYKSQEILSDTADFFLKSLHKEGFTVLSENVNARIDYRRKKGWFKSNEDFALVNFPDNKYISYLDYFVWDMTKKELAMGSPAATAEVDYTNEDSEPDGPRYISLHHEQDSLNFVSPLAYYDYENNFIDARGVKFIRVADARIYPDSGRVTIEPDAKMRKLVNARIRTNVQTRFHTIHTATLNIFGKRNYSGIGNFDYVDENDDVQVIHFSEIKVDDDQQTIASGDIYEEANFMLSPVYHFKGKAFLVSRDSLLTFNGGVILQYNCELPVQSWFSFETRINPEDIYLPVPDRPADIDQQELFSGVQLYYDSVHLYPAFLSAHKSYSDNPVATSSGYLHYDKASNLFKIGSMEKIGDFNLPEDYLSFDRNECRLYGEGKIDLGEDLGQVKLNAFGNVRQEVSTNETFLDIALMMDFFMDPAMIHVMANEIDSAGSLNPVDIGRSVWQKTLHRAIGIEKTQQLTDELTLFGSIKELPPEIRHTIVFSELKLKWNDYRNSYQSVGPIGIASIDDVQINKKMNGFMELQIKRSGDIFDLYLEIDERTYYYFGYTRGVMQTLSSNRVYAETIFNMKPKDRKLKVPRNETSYIYVLSTDRKKNNFYLRYQDALRGVDSEPGTEEEYEDLE
ncbi:MAG: hypothetical protein JW801_11200 [Bacteroidales bacterium]|nr:hypothetical protein [Bacteroidales bacterium]